MNGGGGEVSATSGGRGWGCEVGGEGPAADGEEDFERAVLAFEDVELFEAAIEVDADIVPGVALPVNVSIRPLVCEVSGENVSF